MLSRRCCCSGVPVHRRSAVVLMKAEYEGDAVASMTAPCDWVGCCSPPVSLDGIEASITGVQDYIDIHVTPALAGAVGDIRTLDQEKASLNLPQRLSPGQYSSRTIKTISLCWTFNIADHPQKHPSVQYYGMSIGKPDVVNKQVMDKAIEKAAG